MELTKKAQLYRSQIEKGKEIIKSLLSQENISNRDELS